MVINIYMRNFILIITIVIQISALNINAHAIDSDMSKYELNYKKYIDSKEPLSILRLRENNCVRESEKYFLSNQINPTYTLYYGSHDLQQLVIYTHKGAKPQLKPVIFFIHGMFGDRMNVRPAVSSWLSLGYTVVSVNHRFVPAYPFNEQLADCFMALKWVIDNIQKYGGDPNNIGLTGLSAGGHMAALLVTGTKWHKKYNVDITKVKCWFPMSGFYDLNLSENYLIPMMAEYIKLICIPSKHDASPVAQITGNEPPSLIIHGSDDFTIPKTNAIALHNKLRAKGAKSELAILKNYMHANVFYSYYKSDHVPAKTIKRFLATYLPTAENH